ncbi:hypothetical protein BD779DRAFT_1565288 [Infundibulicybe gibba]|nr:hypothetical protein BD779DRAFT_1565288 [Infundibulicybe gibba]
MPGSAASPKQAPKPTDGATTESTTCEPQTVPVTATPASKQRTDSDSTIASDSSCGAKATPLPIVSTSDVQLFPSFQVRGKWTAARLARVQSAMNLGLTTVAEEAEVDTDAPMPPRRRHSSMGSHSQGQKRSTSENWRRQEMGVGKEKERGDGGQVPIAGGKENEMPVGRKRDVGEVPNWALA